MPDYEKVPDYEQYEASKLGCERVKIESGKYLFMLSINTKKNWWLHF
jgi:hypothetical protein